MRLRPTASTNPPRGANRGVGRGGTASLGSRIPNRLGGHRASETFGPQIPSTLRGPGGMKIPQGGKPKPPAAAPGQPYDAAYQAYLAEQNRQYEIAQAGFAYEGGQEAYQTGFNQNGSENASNPYSQAALLRENYNRSTSGTLNSYANQGQLYSGAYGRQQGENSRNYSIGYNQLANQAAAAYQSLSQRQLQAGAQYGVGLNAQQRAALYRALYPTG